MEYFAVDELGTSYSRWSVATSHGPKACLFQPSCGLVREYGLDDGVEVVAVVAVVHVMLEDLDVPELVEGDGLGVVAAVRRGSCTSGTT